MGDVFRNNLDFIAFMILSLVSAAFLDAKYFLVDMFRN